MINKAATKYTYSIIFVLLIAISNLTHAQVIVNDVKEANGQQYVISGPDPYVIFNPKSTDDQHGRALIIDLGEDIKNKPLELFFESDNDVFNPHYKLSFVANHFPSALLIPDGVDISASTRLRLDINQCSECAVDFKNVPSLKYDLTGLTLIEPERVQNGLNTLSENNLVIPRDDWRLNSLNGVISSFEISGSDPYLVTPPLSISTDQLWAAYFKLKAPRTKELWTTFDLFYQTEQHLFMSKASSSIRIASDVGGAVEFAIPLDFLSKEQPSATMLERLRLDIPNLSGQWAIIDAKLIHQNNANDFGGIVPSQLIHNKRQKAQGWGLLKKILRNITSDLGFTIAYFFLVVLTFVFFVRAYCSNK